MKKHDLEDHLLGTITGSGWRAVGVHHHHGINIYLNALHSSSSCGIGEFLDLIPMIDWCHKIGMDIIQLLPLNDSSFDPSPYNAISSCALNPIYLKLDALPELAEHPDLREQIDSLRAYNSRSAIAYKEVLNAKNQWLRNYFHQISYNLDENQQYQHFLSANPWVETYALFKTLLAKFNYAVLEDWPPEYRSLTSTRRSALIEEHRQEINFHSALQYFCFQQLSEVRAYADRYKILLKGDLPILISRNSADVWQTPHFFDLMHNAGAPPDQYSDDGQNWGFPLFNWDAMRQEDYRFWRERLQFATHFYHLYRIDHAVGFFRIWGIPLHRPGNEGHFFPDDPTKYLPQGKHVLSVLAASSSMLPIAEDLGAVPPEVRLSLNEMGIPGTRVMRWELDWKKHSNGGHPFLPLEDYSPISMTCVSTHDSETLGGWWQKDESQASLLASKKHWHYTPELSQEHRKELLKDSHHTSSLFHINLLQEYLALFPELVASSPEEERINIPGTTLPHNWAYRYRPSIETLTTHKPLLSAMRSLVKK